jgi:hypothetical protein
VSCCGGRSPVRVGVDSAVRSAFRQQRRHPEGAAYLFPLVADLGLLGILYAEANLEPYGRFIQFQ